MDPLEFEIERWRNYATMLHFAKPEDAEKDYLQELLLNELYAEKKGSNFVFRGGTAISKIYGSGRFSGDLDLILASSEANSIDVYVEKAIGRVKLRYDISYKLERYRNMLKYMIKIKGPIYISAMNEQAKQTVEIDLNLYERPMRKIETIQRIPIYTDLGPYILRTETPEELFADKIKAMLERVQPVARDLYDAWFLVKKYNVALDIELVSKKLELYGKHHGETFSIARMKSVINGIGRIWDKEMSRLMLHPPAYKEVKKEFERVIKALANLV